MDPALLQSLQWRLIGPHRGGRVVAVAGHPTEPGTFFFGACAGGVWKTTSGGAYWENVSDRYFKTAAVGAIAVSEADPNVIYVGTGETAIRSNVSHGDGVYRSSDGGRTWRNLGLADTRHIGRIRIHPRDPNVAYVAALGHAWGTNEDRGVFRTTDGGGSWQKILYKSNRAGGIDLSLDPGNPRILYASIWQAQRYPYAMHSGGEDSGLWRSLDGGDSWVDLTMAKGLPAGILGKIGVAASPAQPGRVWAIVEAAEGALFRSDDFGDTWERLSDNPELRRRPWYYLHLYADPGDPNTVWVLNLQCWKSVDGGKSFDAVPTPHGDNHDLWIDPRDSNRMIEGNDGGACVSFDGGRSWSTVLNQPTAQFYHVTTDDQVPYNVYGPQQDNWAMRLPSVGFEGAISWKDYVEPGGGESGYIAIGREPPHTVFGGGIGTGAGHGRLVAWNPETGQKRNVTVWPETHGSGAGAELLKYRFQWTFPVEVSKHDPRTLFICSNYVHKSTDEGESWELVSPDLTRNDQSTLRPSGGPITADNSGAEIYGTIFAFRESPHERGVFWAGSDDGLIHLSRDNGKSWQNVTPADLPEWSMISIIEPSSHDPATAYVAATRYKLDDTHPYLYRTNDYGTTWTPISNGIPEHEFTRVIREDPAQRGLLYAGTETGLFLSFDDGTNWQRFESNLPVVPIWDLVVKDTDLVVATHGRSCWILDDVTPLRQAQAAIADQPAHLFAPRPTVRFRVYNRGNGKASAGYVNYKMTGPVTVAYRSVETSTGAKAEAFLDAGANPPDGAIVHFWLRAKPEGEIKLRILDDVDRVIREFSSTSEQPPRIPTRAGGSNRFVWDLRYAGPTPLADRPSVTPERAQAEATGTAPRALPGSYQIQLTVGDAIYRQPLRIVTDPRLGVTAEDLRAQFDLKLAIRDRISILNELLNQIQHTRLQVEEWERRAQRRGGEEPAIAAVLAAARGLRERLNDVEVEIMQVNADKPQPGTSRVKEKLVTLSGMIDESDHAPTQGARAVFALLHAEVEVAQATLRQLLTEEVAQFGAMIQAAGIPTIVP
jgi:photosystem II stability/assembly factor-like uncharacterized protein